MIKLLFAILLCFSYPELQWLCSDDVRKTEEGVSSAQFVELERTLMTLRCLNLILDGDYETFTAAQKPETRLTREHFAELHEWGQRLAEAVTRQTMEAALVLGDLGKSEQARALFRPYGATAPDHDDFHEEALAILQHHPELSPTFAALPLAAQQLLCATANLIHYGHVTHLEGGPEMFAKLQQAHLDPTALAFDAFIHICDVAGAAGHINPHSSLTYTDTTHRALTAAFEACLQPDPYTYYLHRRAEWLGLDPSDPTPIRIGAMLRLFTPVEGAALKQALSAFDLAPLNLPCPRTPTYMPALLLNLGPNAIPIGIPIGIPFLCRVLTEVHALLARGAYDPTIPLNFNLAAGIAKRDPQALLGDFTIDREGCVRSFVNGEF